MVEKFQELLTKYNLNEESSKDVRLEIARYLLVLNPANTEARLLAYGRMPETLEERSAIDGFIESKNQENRPKGEPGELHYSLKEILQFLSEADLSSNK